MKNKTRIRTPGRRRVCLVFGVSGGVWLVSGSGVLDTDLSGHVELDWIVGRVRASSGIEPSGRRLDCSGLSRRQ